MANRSSYAWLITADHQGATPVAVGALGPDGITEKQAARLWAGEGTTFQLYDELGTHCYAGRAIWATRDETTLLAPLADYGIPTAGCTAIRWADLPLSITCD